MSSEAIPITPARFAEAIKELPASSLALKVLELRNSIAHLDYSNEELKPFAEGRVPTLGSSSDNVPDQDCIDAITENEAVIARMQERIELIKVEVESRGLNWAEFQGRDNKAEEGETNGQQSSEAPTTTTPLTNGTNGHREGDGGDAVAAQHPAWRDGTFQTGTIQGLGDEELLRRLNERMPNLGLQNPDNNSREDDDEGGLHL